MQTATELSLVDLYGFTAWELTLNLSHLDALTLVFEDTFLFRLHWGTEDRQHKAAVQGCSICVLFEAVKCNTLFYQYGNNDQQIASVSCNSGNAVHECGMVLTDERYHRLEALSFGTLTTRYINENLLNFPLPSSSAAVPHSVRYSNNVRILPSKSNHFFTFIVTKVAFSCNRIFQ